MIGKEASKEASEVCSKDLLIQKIDLQPKKMSLV